MCPLGMKRKGEDEGDVKFVLRLKHNQGGKVHRVYVIG